MLRKHTYKKDDTWSWNIKIRHLKPRNSPIEDCPRCKGKFIRTRGPAQKWCLICISLTTSRKHVPPQRKTLISRKLRDRQSYVYDIEPQY